MDLESIFGGLDLSGLSREPHEFDLGDLGDYAGKAKRKKRRAKRKVRRKARVTGVKARSSSRKDLRQSTKDLTRAEKRKARSAGRKKIRTVRKKTRKDLRQSRGLKGTAVPGQRRIKPSGHVSRAPDGTVLLDTATALRILQRNEKPQHWTGKTKVGQGQLRHELVYFIKGRSVSKTHFLRGLGKLARPHATVVGPGAQGLPSSSEEAMAIAAETQGYPQEQWSEQDAYQAETSSPSSYFDGGSSSGGGGGSYFDGGGGGGGGEEVAPYDAGVDAEEDYEDEESGSNTLIIGGVALALLGGFGFYAYKKKQAGEPLS